MSEAMDMQAGEVGFHFLSSEDAVKLGTRDLKKLTYDIKEEAKKLGLEVKVEPMPGGLIFWWAPTEEFNDPERTFFDDLIEHMGVVPKGELDVERALIFGDMRSGPNSMEELIEQLKKISETVKKNFVVTEVHDVQTLHISWEPQWTDNSIAYLGDDGETRVINALPNVAPVEVVRNESETAFLDDYDVDLVKQRTIESAKGVDWNLDENRAYTEEEIALREKHAGWWDDAKGPSDD